MPWPPHLTRIRLLLLESFKLIKLHGRMTAKPKPGTIDGTYRITIVIDVPPPDEPGSARALKRESSRR